MEISFPILVLEKDSGDILQFESIAEMQGYLERMDVENDEYAAWDANGHPVTLVVQEPTWLKVIPASEKGAPDLPHSLKSFAEARRVVLTDTERELTPVALYELIIAKGGIGRRPAGIFRSRSG